LKTYPSNHCINCRWIGDIRDIVGDSAAIIVVGNKKDLYKNREVSVEEASNYAKESGFFFLETSALDNNDKMVERVFEVVALDMVSRREAKDLANNPGDYSDDEGVGAGKKIELTPMAVPKKNKKKCCKQL